MFLIGFKVHWLNITHKIIGLHDDILSIPCIAFATRRCLRSASLSERSTSDGGCTGLAGQSVLVILMNRFQT